MIFAMTMSFEDNSYHGHSWATMVLEIKLCLRELDLFFSPTKHKFGCLEVQVQL